jgi:hypothetical protein
MTANESVRPIVPGDRATGAGHHSVCDFQAGDSCRMTGRLRLVKISKKNVAPGRSIVIIRVRFRRIGSGILFNH